MSVLAKANQGNQGKLKSKTGFVVLKSKMKPKTTQTLKRNAKRTVKQTPKAQVKPMPKPKVKLQPKQNKLKLGQIPRVMKRPLAKLQHKKMVFASRPKLFTSRPKLFASRPHIPNMTKPNKSRPVALQPKSTLLKILKSSITSRPKQLKQIKQNKPIKPNKPNKVLPVVKTRPVPLKPRNILRPPSVTPKTR
jgi:hypothetical protein